MNHLDQLKMSPHLVCVCCSAKQPDHFVSYKYPEAIGTMYSKEFMNEGLGKDVNGEKFILEKEKQDFS
jgi:hypothetical protein